MIFFETESTVVIYDKFPKAKIHLLVVTKCDLRNLEEIDPRSQVHIAAVKDIVSTGEIVREQLRSQLPGKIKFRLGFHALPSMNRVHMHIISQDLDSPYLKNKKHVNSFTTKFFVPASAVLKALADGKRLLLER